MLEALLLAAAQTVTPPPEAAVKPPPAARPAPPPASKPVPPPSAELLEFLADWGGEEAGLIDEISLPGVARPPRKESAP